MSDLAEAQKVLDEKQAELDAVQATYDAAMKSKQVQLFSFESMTKFLTFRQYVLANLPILRYRLPNFSPTFVTSHILIIYPVRISLTMLKLANKR